MLERQRQGDPWSPLACLVETLIGSPCLKKLSEQLRKIPKVSLRLPRAHINTNTYTKEVTHKVHLAKILANFCIITRNFRRQHLVSGVSPSRDSLPSLPLGKKGDVFPHCHPVLCTTLAYSSCEDWSQERSLANVTE